METQLDMQSVPIVIDVDNLTHEEIFNLLTKNGLLKGIYKEGGELYINASFLKSGIIEGLILKAVTGDITGEFTSESINSWGKEWIKLKDAIMTAGLDDKQKSLIDLVAQYGDNSYRMVLKNEDQVSVQSPIFTVETENGTPFKADDNGIHAKNAYSDSWFDSAPGTGWRDETNGGGWFMADEEWIRAYGGKGVYTPGAMYAGSGLETTIINVTKKDLTEAQINVTNKTISGRMVTSANLNFGLYHTTLRKWLIRMDYATGTAHLPDTEIKGDMTVTGTAAFSKTVTFSESVTFNKAPQLYNLTHVTAGGHLVMGSDGATVAYLGGSSWRYKSIRKTVKEADLKEAYNIKVIWAKYKDEYLSESDERYGKEMPMFIAEDIERKFPIAVDHDKQGRAEDWNHRIMLPLMFAMIKNDHEKVTTLQEENQGLRKEVNVLKTELQELKNLINQYIQEA